MPKKILLLFLCVSTFSLYAQNRLYLFTQNQKYGLVDENGTIKVVPEYDEITDLKKNDWTNTTAFLITKDKKSGLMDYYGKWLYPLEYDAILCQNDTCQLTQNNKTGYGKRDGTLIIPVKYEGLGIIKEDKIDALENGKWGYINLKNEWLIKPQFDHATTRVYNFSEGMAKVCLREQENGCGYINEDGVLVIPQIYDRYSGDFHYGLAKIVINNKLAFINKAGKLAFPSNWEYQSTANYKNGVINVHNQCKTYDDYSICNHYLINTKGKNILPKNCILERDVSKDNYAIIRDTISKKEGVINNNGNIIVPIEYEEIGNFGYPFDWIPVSNRNNDGYMLTGFYDRSGKKITECKYREAGLYSYGEDVFICIERQNGQGRGALDKNGKEVIPPDYGRVDLSEDVFKVDNSVYTYIGQSIKPACGYFNKDGSSLIPMQYTSCSSFSNGLAVVLDNEGWKIINKQNEIVTLLGNKYKSVSQLSNGRAIVSKEGGDSKSSYGLINTKGELVVPFIYDYIYHYNDVIQVRNKQKYGIINPEGKIIVPLEYDNTSLSACNGKVYGTKEGKLFWYDLEGKRLSNNIPLEQCIGDYDD
ncbi:MAG: WG repeat-containing protein [Aestuariibaculum sp.]